MSDSNFINAYNEVVLENLVAVLKQNFMYQTQIKFLEERVSLIPALEERAKSNDLTVIEKKRLEDVLITLRSDIENRDSIIKNSVNNDAERLRLQSALNEQAKELEDLKSKVTSFEKLSDEQKEQIKELEDLKNKVNSFEKLSDEQKEQIKELEDIISASKKKKLNLEDEIKPVEKVFAKDNVKLNIEASGGRF